MSATGKGAMLALLLVGAGGAAPNEPEPRPFVPGSTNPDAHSRVEQTDEALARAVRANGLARGLAERFTADGVLLEPGLELVQGADAVGALGGPRPRVTSRRLGLGAFGAGVSLDGTLAYTFGVYEDHDGRATEHGKYLAVWRSTPDGWRLAAFARAPGRREAAPAPEHDHAVSGGLPRGSPGEPSRLAAEVMATDTAFGRRAEADGPCVAFPAFAHRDAVVFGGGDFGWGLEAVRRAWSDCDPGSGPKLRFAPVHAGAASSGDLGWSAGNATFSSGDPKAPTLRHTKYLTVWVREPDGGWKWLLDTGNARPAPR